MYIKEELTTRLFPVAGEAISTKCFAPSFALTKALERGSEVKLISFLLFAFSMLRHFSLLFYIYVVYSGEWVERSTSSRLSKGSHNFSPSLTILSQYRRFFPCQIYLAKQFLSRSVSMSRVVFLMVSERFEMFLLTLTWRHYFPAVVRRDRTISISVLL